jgi:hypothetical protein
MHAWSRIGVRKKGFLLVLCHITPAWRIACLFTGMSGIEGRNELTADPRSLLEMLPGICRTWMPTELEAECYLNQLIERVTSVAGARPTFGWLRSLST